MKVLLLCVALQLDQFALMDLYFKSMAKQAEERAQQQKVEKEIRLHRIVKLYSELNKLFNHLAEVQNKQLHNELEDMLDVDTQKEIQNLIKEIKKRVDELERLNK